MSTKNALTKPVQALVDEAVLWCDCWHAWESQRLLFAVDETLQAVYAGKSKTASKAFMKCWRDALDIATTSEQGHLTQLLTRRVTHRMARLGNAAVVYQY